MNHQCDILWVILIVPLILISYNTHYNRRDFGLDFGTSYKKNHIIVLALNDIGIWYLNKCNNYTVISR